MTWTTKRRTRKTNEERGDAPSITILLLASHAAATTNRETYSITLSSTTVAGFPSVEKDEYCTISRQQNIRAGQADKNRGPSTFKNNDDAFRSRRPPFPAARRANVATLMNHWTEPKTRAATEARYKRKKLLGSNWLLSSARPSSIRRPYLIKDIKSQRATSGS